MKRTVAGIKKMISIHGGQRGEDGTAVTIEINPAIK
jgi:hypothetical protein